MKKILVKLTSRERSKALKECLIRMKELAKFSEDIQYLLTLDSDDNTLSLVFTDQIFNDCILDFGVSKNKINAINRGVPKEGWQILVNVSDDQICELKDWDHYIRGLMPDDLDASIWAFDGQQNRINTLEIVGFNYYKRFNYIYNPAYKSFYCDNESTAIAAKLGKQIKTNQMIFYHDHPQVNGNKDSLFKRNQKYWHEDERTWKLNSASL